MLKNGGSIMHNKKIMEILNDGRIHLSCELFPPKQGAELQNSLEIVNRIAAVKPSYMSVTYGAGGSTVGYSAALAKEVQDNGLPALAHLTCVKADEVKITEVLQQLQGHGVNNILALRGDIPADMQGDHQGRFAHASDLMRFVKEQGDFCVGGAAYPEGHPESGSLEQDIENTKYKVEAGVDFLVTQMFFDNTILYNYMFRLLRAGINVPVIPGIMPCINAAQIQRMVTMCGAKFPEKFQKIVHRYGDNKAALFDAGMSYCESQIIELLANDVEGIHLYTMNNVRVAKRLTEGIKNLI